MTDQHHPITPPPELIAKWITEARFQDYCSITEQVAYYASQWGYEQRGKVNEAKLQQARDQELEATLAEVSFLNSRALADRVRAARRPNPSSLREEALAKTTALLDDPGRALLIEVREILELNRRALEALPDD